MFSTKNSKTFGTLKVGGDMANRTRIKWAMAGAETDGDRWCLKCGEEAGEAESIGKMQRGRVSKVGKFTVR